MGYLALLLHAHLPFVRHPEHEQFLEEHWLFEAITETYLPLLGLLEAWRRDGVAGRLTLTLSPTLCSMLQDPVLQQRYLRHLAGLIELADKEILRTHWEKSFHQQAVFYRERFEHSRRQFLAYGQDLVAPFRTAQDVGQIEIMTCAATHALLPLMQHPPSVRAQILIARDHYRDCFGRDPQGIWLPECAYAETLESALKEAGLRWFVLDTHGILHARPQPRYSIFAPILTGTGLTAFGRDPDSARQVWSRDAGYPGDPRYREFYRDVGFDLDWDYVRPHLAAAGQRGFTGIKYYRITGGSESKQVYDRSAALAAADEHATHFLASKIAQVQKVATILDRPPLVVAPYDAELFGHWWYEGPEFLDLFVRKAVFDQKEFSLISPGDYLQRHPANQVANPSASSWGEEGYWSVWLNENNAWIYPHLGVAQLRMSELAARFQQPAPVEARALRQAARELLLAQASDWPFIIRAGTSPDYARRRVTDHLLEFTSLYEQLNRGQIDEASLSRLETRDNIFPEINYRYWV